MAFSSRGPTQDGRVKPEVVAPGTDNTEVILHNRHGASANDIIKTYDFHNTPGLAALNGTLVQGDWRLTVSDHARRDVGELRRWNIEIGLAAASQIQMESEPFVIIPDNDPNGIADTIEINQQGKVRDIKVMLDITHSWIGDLKVELTTPSSTSIMLHDRSGGPRDNIIQTFNTQNLTAMQGLIGLEASGEWTLKVYDHAGRDVGKLNRWGLEIAF